EQSEQPNLRESLFLAALMREEPEAKRNLREMYFSRAVARQKSNDPMTAVYFYRSAELGDSEAMSALGELYYYGDYHGGAIPKDFALAYMWFSIAKHCGGPPPAVVTEDLEKRLTREDKAMATKLADDWIKDHPDVLR